MRRHMRTIQQKGGAFSSSISFFYEPIKTTHIETFDAELGERDAADTRPNALYVNINLFIAAQPTRTSRKRSDIFN